MRKTVKDVKSFYLVYLIYSVPSVVITSFLLFFTLSLVEKFTSSKPITIYCDFLKNSENVPTVIYLTIFFLVLLSSVSYITHTYIKKPHHAVMGLDELTASINEMTERVSVAANCNNLVCVDFKALMKIEKSFDCKSIFIITNDVNDDMDDKTFFGIIRDNIERGKKYTFLLPNIHSNTTTARKLVSKLYQQLSANKKKDIDTLFSVYLVNDQLFRICSFRDIAVYGADSSDQKTIGYVEIPHINKGKENADKRLFIEMDHNICIDVVNEINGIIEHSKLIEKVPCPITVM